jgi:DNA-binding NarL/FixJ family response regulator
MKVLIVEDDPLHRSYLHEQVSAALPECGEIYEAENGQQGETLARLHGSAYVVMDLQMNGRNGIEAARTIWRERAETRILFWSNYADEAFVRGVSRIVPNGAAYGYVLKSTSEERLKLALRSIFIENQCVIDNEVRGMQQRSFAQVSGFSDSEYEILMDIALGLTAGFRSGRFRTVCSRFTPSLACTRPLIQSAKRARSTFAPGPSRWPPCGNF